ncbi:SdpI/YhfL protein family protein [Parasporobacterium paucivorans DSM 15970]|uniref:SdpI/YhfL protein family protein n=2 Tax=Parasporobacterium TaxID=115543 RepID=A0A1M6JYD7_9FIRM|nr:SdpI/YhfL protein family protein [Parasporobacterium paucivorans DSM 15970]
MILSFWFNLFFGTMIPVIIIAIGVVFKNHPPKEINSFAGYRTSRSMKSKETWEFANKYSARLMLLCGIILLIITVPILLVFRNESEEIQGVVMVALCTVQTVAVVLTIIPVEKALKNRFDNRG